MVLRESFSLIYERKEENNELWEISEQYLIYYRNYKESTKLHGFNNFHCA